jgi:CheY-like chemotaxis protein
VEGKGMDTQSVDEGKRVLVVDDMRINIMVLSAKLKKLNYRCEGAESAARALELITTFKPDIILTDLWMPEMNGDVLAKKIRELPDYDKRPIFVVTADISNQTGFDMSVFTGVLQKPIDDALLQELLASASSSS